ncbi:MAG: metallophosphoesterase family protein [Candidatus Heimdallarchaeaceae archaeon]
MAKIAIISDVHANIYALEAVLKDIQRKRNIDEIICLGDVVGYYPYPNECIELIKEQCSLTMLGNHDAGVIGDEPSFYFNPVAYEMITWTKENIKPEHMQWLTTLPRRRTIEKNGKSIYLVHGSPFKVFDYMDSHSEKHWNVMLGEAFEKIQTGVLIVGHTHVPVRKKFKGKHFLNPGSVGQPRNGTPGAFYSIINTSPFSSSIVHLKYDFSPLQERMEKLGLPKTLSDRLNHGV